MPNIRTLAESRPSQPPQGRGPRIQRLGDSSNRDSSVSDVEAQPQSNDFQLFGAAPSPGSPLPSIGDLLCPRFKWSFRSFIFTVSVIDILYFIASLIVNAVYNNGHAFDLNNKMLGPSASTFLLLGAKFTLYIKQGQVYRLLCPIFMHAGIIHLLFNLFFQCSIGFRMEEVWGIPRMMVIYFAAGIGGNLMSALINTTGISVGASGALFGILGGMLAFLIGNWNDIPGACMSACNVVLMIVINFLMGFSGLVDNYAHLGGLISGFCVALAYPKKVTGHMESKDSHLLKIGVFLSLVYYAVTISLLFAF